MCGTQILIPSTLHLVLILLATQFLTGLEGSVQDESTNIADLLPSIDSSNQIVSWDPGNLASTNDLIPAESSPPPASPPISPNRAIASSPSFAANPLIATIPSNPTISSKQNPPSNSIQIASPGKRKGHCPPSGVQTTGKVRRGDVCTYSWEDDPNSREDFICPIEFHLLCCLGKIFRFIYTLRCFECKRSFCVCGRGDCRPDLAKQ